MRLLRWVVLLPAALLAGMAASLAGGFLVIPFGQAAIDTASAFAGPFAFVCAAGLIAPARRRDVGVVTASLVAVLALGTFVLSTFTSVEEFSQLSERARILTPTAQLLGALYALFVFRPFVTPEATLEDLHRELLALAGVAAILGGALSVIGLVVGFVGRGWFVLGVGIGVLALAVVTWLFPFLHISLRVWTAGPVFKKHEDVPAVHADPTREATIQEFRTYYQGLLRHGGEQQLRLYFSLEREAAERLGPDNRREFLAVVDLLEKELLPPQR